MSTELTTQLKEADEQLRKLSSELDKEESVILEKLNALKVVIVTAEALRASGLNKVLNELRKCSNARIAGCAKEVVETYKTLLRGAPGAPTPTPLASPPASTSSSNVPTLPTITEPLTPAGPTKRKADDSEEQPDAKRSVVPPTSTPSYLLSSTGNVVRDKAQKLIYDALGSDDNDATEFRTELAVRIEEAIHERFEKEGGAASSEYKSRLRVILGNLKDPKNPDINQRLYFCEIDPKDLATMSEFDMASDALKLQRESELRDSIEARKTDLNVGSVGTDMFQCPKCKERKTSFYQRQTRSSDEPMTIFLTCLCCRHRWRQY